MRGFLVDERVDDLLRCNHQETLGVELPRLAEDLAEDLVANRCGCLDGAAAHANRAALA